LRRRRDGGANSSIVAAMRKTRLRLRRGTALWRGDEAEHDGALADGLGET
jgi:hypothetical protein